MQSLLTEIASFYTAYGEKTTPYLIGALFELAMFGLLVIGYKVFKHSSVVVFFDMVFEKMYEFFEGILGEGEKKWIKIYITSLFFIILFSNLFGVVLELIAPIFYSNAEKAIDIHHIAHYIKIPTSDINFNIAMAVVGVLIILYEQFTHLGLRKALYEYFPVFGKNYIPYERGNLPGYIDIPLFIFIKMFDIIISLFLGVLEIVGHGAKIISLAFRLFGNVTSGGILLGMLVLGLAKLSKTVLGFEFPILFLDIIYLQEILVSCIQALVFPLLVAIFIKVAKVH